MQNSRAKNFLFAKQNAQVFQQTFLWEPYSLRRTGLTASNFFIRIPVPPRASTHSYLHHSSAKGLPIPLQCENNLNWASARPWCTAWEAHEGKLLCDILCAHWNTKQKVSNHRKDIKVGSFKGNLGCQGKLALSWLKSKITNFTG